MASNQISTSPYLLSDANQASYRYNGEVPPEEALEQQSLNRRQHIANLLIQQGLGGGNRGQMVGRFYVPGSPVQGLADLAKVAVGAYGTHTIDEQRQGLAEKNRNVLAEAMQAYRAKTGPQSTTTELEGPGAPEAASTANDWVNLLSPGEVAQGRIAEELAKGGPGMVQEGPRPTVTTEQPATPEARKQALVDLLATQHPQAQQLGKMLMQQEQHAQDVAAQREFQGSENALNREVRREGIDANALSRAEQIRGNILTTQMMIEGRDRAGQDSADLKRELARMNADLQITLKGMDVAGKKEVQGMKGEKGKSLPGSVGGKFMENSQNLRMAERALGLITGQTVEGAKGDPGATGWKGYAPDVALQRMDPAGTDTRAAIANLGSMIIHDRSGAAVTAAEYPRLRPFIPTVTDDPATVKKKLSQFIHEYQKINDEMTQFYTESGYTVPSSDWHQSPESVAPATSGEVAPFNDAEKERRYQEWKKTHK